MSEREARVARLRAGRDRVQAAGGRAGGQLPYGWHAKRGRALVCSQEQATLRLMLRLRHDGWAYERIAGELNRLGIPPRKASAWTLDRVRMIVRRATSDPRWAPVDDRQSPGQQLLAFLLEHDGKGAATG